MLEAPNYEFIPIDMKISHKIETIGSPVYCKARHLSPAKEEFDRLLDHKIIQPSVCPWASPLRMVAKGDGSWRPYSDYCRLNASTIPDRYAIPNLMTIHHKLSGAAVFSRLDLAKAFHFVHINEEDIPMTDICTPFGTY